MIMMVYNTSIDKYDTNSLQYIKTLDDDTTLTALFAEFIDFARVIGYQHGSWKKIIQDVQEYFDEDFNIYDYSLDNCKL